MTLVLDWSGGGRHKSPAGDSGPSSHVTGQAMHAPSVYFIFT